MAFLVSTVVVLLLGASCGGESRHRSSGSEPNGDTDAAPPDGNCTGTTKDCNEDPSDGCETDLANDGDHCGACGTGCGLAPCIGGTCGAPPERVGSGDRPCEMVTDGETVCWGLCLIGEIWALPATGDAPAELVATVTYGRAWFYDMAIDDEAVYWTNPGVPSLPGDTPGGIGRLIKGDDRVERLITEANVWGIALDGDRLYWTRSVLSDDGSPSGAILEGLTSGEVLGTLAEIPAEQIAVDDEAVYFRNPTTDSIERLEKTGGEPVELAAGFGLLYGLAAHDGYVHWADDAGLSRVPRDGGAAERIDDVAGPFVIDGETIYYERRGVIVARQGDDVTPLGRITGSTGGIVVAGGYLYVADFNEGSVYRIGL